MRDVYERVSGRVGFPLLLQGTAPRSILLDRFRSTPNAVLFATASFWQGVDVPGAQLSCVIIDKLPFAVPSDPIVAARVRALQEDGRNAFAEYQVPEAVLALKQGFGRLIRSKTDRGILAILDNRIQRMQYGKIFLESLPEYATTQDLAEVARFMEDAPISELAKARGASVEPDSKDIRQTACTKSALTKTFAAAHNLRDYKGKCEDLHGHNYKVRVTVAGPGTRFRWAAVRFRAPEAGDSGRDSGRSITNI